mgnify:CR=1 FL=1
MATNIPTHNLSEVINGIFALIQNPEITTEGLMEHILAPDFPTGGIILGLKNVKQAYKTGMGTVTVRGKIKIVNLPNNKKEIINKAKDEARNILISAKEDANDIIKELEKSSSNKESNKLRNKLNEKWKIGGK